MSEKETQSPKEQPLSIADDCVVAFHYRLCEVKDDGEKTQWFEESFGKSPLHYLHGHDNVVPGLEAAMAGKQEGDKIAITLSPEQAYGPRRDNSIQRVPIKHLHLRPGHKKIQPGEIIAIQTDRGVVNAMVVKAGRFNVDVDTNHPFAGKTLHYEIEIVSVRKATQEEVAHRHVHGAGGHQH
ncbi:MAG: peptidylprolyl isomerase [Pseudohongiellaceae bacterium]|nr:peptidylprolyl isomerase [Pseudohongiellaceae bacterium]